MAAEIRAMTFTSGTLTGDFTGLHGVVYTVLCGVSGAAAIPLRCDNTGLLLTSGVN